MELRYDNRVLFDPISHSYLLDGDKLLMGVTELMKKHGLSAYYGNISEEVLAHAAEEGTAIHREIQNYDDGEGVLVTPLLEEYKKLCEENGLKSVASEYPVSDYDIIASAIDKVYEVKGGVVLVDIKCTSDYHKRPVEFQLGIYKWLFKRINPDIPVVGCYCLWIEKKKRKIRKFIRVEPVPEREVERLLEAEKAGGEYVDNGEKESLGIEVPKTAIAAYVESAGQLAELKANIKKIEKEISGFDKQILAYMEENNLDEIPTPGGVIKRKAGYVRDGVDTDKLKEKYNNIYELVKKETSVSGSISFKPNKE